MKHKLLDQARHEYSPQRRIAALIVEGIFFLGILPGAVIYFSSLLDRLLKLPSIAFGMFNLLLGCGLIVAGLLFAWWSIYVQFTIGRGTPVPIMATQQLIIQKSYAYCRNPMALGTMVAGLGLAILIASISAVALVLALAALLLVYIKLVEEKEMEARFGEAYRAYRKQTPLIIPRFRKRS
ncbi:MAG TPA: isoprenylcysteine carboxylmethyltransferase family protein [Anaerolineales bacterium]|nr:isoprenylcysteine carboxylmethyltransferase family protein [Anaerolineales bacterium]